MATKLTDEQLVRLKPIIHKFSELLDNIDNGDPKRIPRHIKDFAKSKFPPFSPPFVDAANAALALKKDEGEKAVTLARKILETKTSEGNICNLLIRIFKTYNDPKHLAELYQMIIDYNPTDVEPLFWDLPFQITCSNFVKAQERAMKIVSLSKDNMREKENSIIFAAAFSYFRGKYDKPLFYKFANSFIDKITTRNSDIVEIKIECLINQDPNNKSNLEAALNYVKSQEAEKAFSHDELHRARIEMKIQTALGNFSAVGEKAAEILNTINADSIDEWKLAVQHYSDIDNLIKKHNDGKLRGPQLALIELALHRKEDPTPLIIEYATKYANKSYLLGDISPYLTPEVLPKLSSIDDPAIQCLVSDKFDDSRFQITNEATANMKAQELIRTGDFASLCQAASILDPYKAEGTSRVLLIRIAGLLNAPVAQNRLWTEQRLEAIQYLSLLSLYLFDITRGWDIDDLKNMARLTNSFCEKGIGSYVGHVNAALHNYNFLIAEMATQFHHQITHNISYYVMRVLQDWLTLLTDIEELTPYKYEKYLSIKEIQDTLEERIDDSIFPIYFKNDNKEDHLLREKLFPSIKNLVCQISAAMRLIFALKLDKGNVDAFAEELNQAATGTQWAILADFVKNGCKKVNFQACGDSVVPDVLLFGSLAIAAKLSNSPKEVKDAIAGETNKANQKLLESMKLDELPEIFKKHNEQQTQSLHNAKEMILNLLK
ncbi:hypothetical protein M9Y10_008494 [Tritrichomonas musculus]|uniref:Uncharacterized protein n=1 Tax=Tritrichomonas musculus TaxID=1915356 RepID=A0ABR2IZD3_9EUKA